LLDLSARLKATGMDASAIFPNIRALKGVLDLTGKGAADNVKIFDALGNTMGATDEAFQKTSESASFQFKQGMETMKSSLLEIGQIILPAVIKAVQSLSGFIKGLSDGFKNLSPTTQKIALTLAGIAASAGPVLIIFGKIMTGLSSLGPILTIVTTGFRLLTAAMVANPILAVAAAIAAVVLALNKYKKAQKEATAETVKTLDKKQIDDRLEAAEAELKYLDTLEAKRRFSIGAHKAKTKELKNEILLLKERKTALEQNVLAEKQVAEPQTTSDVFTLPEVDVPKKRQKAVGVLDQTGLSAEGIKTPITDSIKADTAGIPAAIAEQGAVLTENQLLLFAVDSTLYTATNEVWGYKWYEAGDQRAQSAWFRWTLPNNVIYHTIMDDKYYAILNKDSTYTLEKFDIKLSSATPMIGSPPDENRVHLDTKKTIASGDMTYNSATDVTTFTLGAGFYSSRTLTAYCITDSDAAGKSYDIPSSAITGTAPNETVTLPGNWKTSTEAGASTSSVNTDLIVGYEYEFEVELPKVYVTRAEGDKTRSETRGSLVIHRMNFDFGDVGVLDITLQRKGRADYTYTVESKEWNNINASTAAIAPEYRHTIPVYDRNTNLSVFIKSNHPSPATLHSMNWEGDYSPRYYQRV